MTTNPPARTRHLLCREAGAGLLLPERRGAPGLPRLRLPREGLALSCPGCPQPPLAVSPCPRRQLGPGGCGSRSGSGLGEGGWWLE